jgi:hypothetical protein
MKNQRMHQPHFPEYKKEAKKTALSWESFRGSRCLTESKKGKRRFSEALKIWGRTLKIDLKFQKSVKSFKEEKYRVIGEFESGYVDGLDLNSVWWVLWWESSWWSQGGTLQRKETRHSVGVRMVFNDPEEFYNALLASLMEVPRPAECGPTLLFI